MTRRHRRGIGSAERREPADRAAAKASRGPGARAWSQSGAKRVKIQLRIARPADSDMGSAARGARTAHLDRSFGPASLLARSTPASRPQRRARAQKHFTGAFHRRSRARGC
eukprot:1934662-Pleurochrysis_carterae.AAC.2